MPIDLGGGGGSSFFGQTLTATASGAISNGDPVILNADGTVSKPSAEGITGVAGLKMFVLSDLGNSVYEYALSSPYNVLSATSTGVSFSVNAQETQAMGLAFNNDGTKMYIVGISSDSVHEYDLSTAWDISTASFSQSFSVSAQDLFPRGLRFNADGTKMYIAGDYNNSIREYDLGTAFDISTATYGRNFSVGTQTGTPFGLAFQTDGSRMFVASNSDNTIYGYNLSTDFNVTTASYWSSEAIGSFNTSIEDVLFKPDGTEMYVVGRGPYAIEVFSLATPWFFYSAVYVGRVSTVSGNDMAFGDGSLSNLSQGRYLGIADGDYADGATATIQLAGAVDDAQTGLTAGKTYYVQQDGSLAVTPAVPEVEAGYAISATELLVKGAYSSVTSEGAYASPPMAFDLKGLSRGQRLMFTSSTALTPGEDITVLVTCVGAGSSGDISTSATVKNAGGAGGLCQSMLTLTAGETYTLTVGAGSDTGTGGSTSFSGTGVTTMTASGGGRPTGGSASGGNIANNKGGDGFVGVYGGGGAIGVLSGGEAGAAQGGSIDFLPDIFPIYVSFNGAQGANSVSGYQSPLGSFSFGGRSGSGYGCAGASGGTGSGGGGAYSSRSAVGGSGGFPGGGGGSVYSGDSSYAYKQGAGADGCIVIEVL
jgi:WD40 repeat protein